MKAKKTFLKYITVGWAGESSRVLIISDWQRKKFSAD